MADPLEQAAVDVIRVDLSRRTEQVISVPPREGDLRADFHSHIPMGGTEGSCAPGFAGYAIDLTGLYIRSYTYYDLGMTPLRRGTITPELERLLREVLDRWDLH